MTLNPISVSLKAKGILSLLHRFRSIINRYGFNTIQMESALRQFSEILNRFDCSATFPITAMALKRHRKIISKYLDSNIEFAIHGYTHINYSQLPKQTQYFHLLQAKEIFIQAGITPLGFRSPYLGRNDSLDDAICEAGFLYSSNQPILSEIKDLINLLSPEAQKSYERAIAFYDPWFASSSISIPRLKKKLVEIPISLPDDEILVDRLECSSEIIAQTWRKILLQTYQFGELFVLQLHPERIEICKQALKAVLDEAKSLQPAVWCARLDEIATWWKARTEAEILISKIADDEYHFAVNGPKETSILAREIIVDAPITARINGYQEVKSFDFTFKSSVKPVIGYSPSTSNTLVYFLQQLGYILEICQDNEPYAYKIDLAEFDVSQEREVVNQIEVSGCPLLRLGQWPNSAQSALSITGDIDALTVWDYGLRLIGK